MKICSKNIGTGMSTKIQIFRYFGPQINIQIKNFYISDIQMYSNILLKLRIYLNVFCLLFFRLKGPQYNNKKLHIKNKFLNKYI